MHSRGDGSCRPYVQQPYEASIALASDLSRYDKTLGMMHAIMQGRIVSNGAPAAKLGRSQPGCARPRRPAVGATAPPRARRRAAAQPPQWRSSPVGVSKQCFQHFALFCQRLGSGSNGRDAAFDVRAGRHCCCAQPVLRIGGMIIEL